MQGAQVHLSALPPAARPGAAPSAPGQRLAAAPPSAEWSSLASGLKPAPLGSGSATPSELNTSVGGTSRSQVGFERRVAWLEEDVAVLHRRLRDECGEGAAAGAASDGGLRSLVTLLDSELAAERQAREALESRMGQLEDSIARERRERESQLRCFSEELEATMRGLIGRIDEGISAGAASMRERTDQTELRLRTLIRRVDEGLSAGAAALQDTLGTGLVPGEAPPAAAAAEAPGPRPAPGPEAAGEARRRAWAPGAAGEAPGAGAASEELVQSWEQLRQENLKLRERRAQLYGARSPGAAAAPRGLAAGTPQGAGAAPGPKAGSPQGVTPAATPSLAYPGTLQVPGSGLNAAPGIAGAPVVAAFAGSFSRGGAGSPVHARNPNLLPSNSGAVPASAGASGLGS